MTVTAPIQITRLSVAFCVLGTFLFGCASSEIEIDPFITNQAAEEKYEQALGDRNEMLLFVESLSNRHASGFDWISWFEFLKTQEPAFSGEDAEGWSRLFKLQHFVCAGETGWIVYYDYLSSLYSAQIFDPRPLAFSSMSSCMPILPEDVAWDLLAYELLEKTSGISLVRANYALNSISPKRLDNLSDEQWAALLGVLRMEYDQNPQSPSVDQTLNFIARNPLLSVEKIDQMAALLVFMEERSPSQIETSGLQQRRLLMGLTAEREVRKSGDYLGWWIEQMRLVNQLMEDGELDLDQVFLYYERSLEGLSFEQLQKTVSKTNKPDDRLQKWVRSFDEFSDKVFQFIQSDARRMKSLELRASDVSLASPMLLWWQTMRNGGLPLRQVSIIESRVEEIANLPLHAWLLWRVSIRSKLKLSFWQRDEWFDGRAVSWRGPEDVCPVPELNEEGELQLSRQWIRSFTSESEEASTGCYVNVDPSKLSSATYDSFILARETDLFSLSFDRAIVDLSGSPAPTYDFELIPGEEAEVFPVIFVERVNLRNQESRLNRKKDRDPIRWFVLHIQLRPSQAPRFLIDGEIYDELPEPVAGGDGGAVAFEQRPNSEFPVWIRSYGAPGADAYPEYEGVAAVRMSGLKRNFFLANQEIAEILAKDWEALPGYSVFPGTELLRILSKEELDLIQIGNFRPLNAEETFRVYNQSDSMLADSFNREVFSQEVDWFSIALSGLQRTKSDAYAFRLEDFSAFPVDDIWAEEILGSDSFENGDFGRAGESTCGFCNIHFYSGVSVWR